MAGTGRDEPGAASEKRSERHAVPFDSCSEWFEKMKVWFEIGGGGMDCCEAMRRSGRAEREAEKGNS